ncbi:zf-ZPR1-domain-containing protein [Nadsonia fulvescens var. elongata DSM 6958]|uniref:Zf-ZPR1-domain-containing protein n=1 Tax=Nadsonia fulvescens var. elongata DSM 6958 TaxID=857566 RepID=A0A1E3PMN5_9ASCO|nr:zf-ZPR1-domain-containing protein [Nadsonia fulvescens var. elongata DSM 6958]
MSKTHEKKEDLFSSVGDAVDELDHQDQVEDEQGLRKTGATDVEGHPVQEIDSLCMYCHETGVTRLLMTRIPFFREIVIMSFECPHCHYKTAEIQPASEIQEKGSRYQLKIEGKTDLDRQVIKSETCASIFKELDIEIPAKRGQLTTVEGILQQIASDLESDQPARLTIDPDTHAKIQSIIDKVKSVIDGDEVNFPITFTVDDPSGNSWIEYKPGEPAHKWSHSEYFRTKEQNAFLGLAPPEDQPSMSTSTTSVSDNSAETDKARNPSATTMLSDNSEIENLNTEVQTFNASCPVCFSNCPTHMKIVNIPHFKDVIIMSTVCDECGYKSNEVKTGGAVPEKGKTITLLIDDAEDLARDILKSETCGLSIPELDLDLTPGTLGGRFTTIEGLLKQVHEELKSRVFTETSDSMDDETHNRWKNFLARLMDAAEAKIAFTVIMTDPLAASYIQNVYAPDADPNMTIVEFDRTQEQNDDLGLSDMNVEENHGDNHVAEPVKSK